MNHFICIFEDNKYAQLNPLSLTRPVFDLHCGMVSLKEKIIRQFPDDKIGLFCRNYLKDLVEQQNPSYSVNKINTESCVFVNGRVIWDPEMMKSFSIEKEAVYFCQGQVVGAFLKEAHLTDFMTLLENESDLGSLNNIPRKEIDGVCFINYTWDLIHHNPSEIEKDFMYFKKGGRIEGEISEHAVLTDKSNIYIGKDAVIKPGVILDADEGPIYIDQGAEIMHNAVIQGPCYIGKNSKIKIGAKIYEGTSVGEVCKVGGEVEESIIHSYSNKQHDGFLGHAYLGQWVNLGADTNNSDLKNNYGNVKVFVNGELIDSGSMFVGLTMGDHSKSGINTMFNTGTVAGVMCNIFGSDFLPKYIPSFSWGSARKMMEYKLDKALQTARLVMGRRNQEITPEYEKMLKYVYDLTSSNRKS